MSRQGGWIIQAPHIKPLSKPLQLRLKTERQVSDEVEERSLLSDERLLRNARTVRIKTRLSLQSLREVNRKLEAHRETRKSLRKKVLIQKIKMAEAKGEIREAESLKWHLEHFFSEVS